jgi:hypothetical protein
MIKIITFIFCLNCCASFANYNSIDKNSVIINKTIDRFLYEMYFKHLYKYEPSVIRENKISNLVLKETKKIGDSIISSELKHKIEFRKNGRPKQMTEWFDYQKYALISDYSYDSLGNLIEYHIWSSTHNFRDDKKIKKSKTRYFFEYENGLLNKVIHYENNFNNRQLTLRSCDSLSCKIEEKKITIFHGNSDKLTIEFTLKPTFIYPTQTASIENFVFTESKDTNKYTDKESLWEIDCKYSNLVLIELQSLTNNLCLNNTIVNACKGSSSFFSSDPKDLAVEIRYGEKKEIMSSDVISVDTIKKQIYIKQNYMISEPTSLENRNTISNSLLTFDYSLNLIKNEAIIEKSRGEHEYSKDSIETYFTYFNFDMLQRKVTLHYNQNLNNYWGIYSKDNKQGKDFQARVVEEETEIETY